jgi:hypothetical protein
VQIKASWWQAVFGAETIARFPRLKLIHWFDIRKANDYEVSLCHGMAAERSTMIVWAWQ